MYERQEPPVNNRKFSLLHLPSSEEEPAGCDILYDLSIDRAMHQICTDRKRTDYFLDVVAHPLCTVENITYRQELFADFLAFPELFEKLSLQFTRYDRIKSDWQEMKLGTPPSAAISNPEALLEHTFSSLKVTAFFPGTIVTFFHTIHELLCKYDITSRALISMRDYCGEMIQNDSLDEVVRIAQLFRYHSPEHFTFDLAIRLDEMLRVSACELCGIEIYEEKSKLQTALGKIFGKKDTTVRVTVDTATDGTAYEDALIFLNDALRHIDNALTRITGSIYDILYGISRELHFYEIGIAYLDHVHSCALPTCVPKMLPATCDRLVMHGVRDLVLASDTADPSSIVPNDMEIEDLNGILVRGLTDTGKTVYLRSCGTAMLFAQAGLPILAQDAELSIRTAFFSHFSSAEEEFLKGDVTGRFDQEAKEIAGIMDHLVPHCLVILNETFQTTSYREGTEAIYNILSVLPLVPAKFLFVTHLTRLFDRMDASKVCLMETDPAGKYKLKRIRATDRIQEGDDCQ